MSCLVQPHVAIAAIAIIHAFCQSLLPLMGQVILICAKRNEVFDCGANRPTLLCATRLVSSIDVSCLYFAEAGVSRGFCVLLCLGLTLQHAVALETFQREAINVGELPGRFGLVCQLFGLPENGFVFNGKHRSSRSTLFVRERTKYNE